MKSAPRPLPSPAQRIRFYLLLALLAFCVLGGGASRADVVSLLYLRPAAILCVAAMLAVPGGWDLRTVRVPMLLLAGLAAIMLIQLVPLPPDLWQSLPGRARYLEAAAAAGLPEPWRPISLTPDLTLNSLLTLIFPVGALIGFAGISEDQRRTLLPVLIGVACISAVFGIVQVTGGYYATALYLYEVTHRGSAVGFFSNRNHQALLLAMAFPMLKLWSLLPAKDPNYQRTRYWIASATGLFLIPMILVTGSRAGMALGLLSLVATHFLLPGARHPAGPGLWRRIATPAMWLAPIALAVVAILLGRAVAIDRIATMGDFQSELRVQHTPLMIRMIGEFFPFGTGFGSFDPVFRGFEPDHALNPSYFNHAHNDLIELVLTGGLAALLVFVLFLVWWALRSIPAFRPFRTRSQTALLARVGSLMILLAMAASVVDYPLRTPLMAVVFAIACGWLAQSRSDRPHHEREGNQ